MPQEEVKSHKPGAIRQTFFYNSINLKFLQVYRCCWWFNPCVLVGVDFKLQSLKQPEFLCLFWGVVRTEETEDTGFIPKLVSKGRKQKSEISAGR